MAVATRFRMLPDFVQALSPFLPLTHAINALRAAMMGLYQMDFWVEIGLLLVFVVLYVAWSSFKKAFDESSELVRTKN